MRRLSTLALILIAVMVTFAGFACSSETEEPVPEAGDGKVIVPDADWETADVPEENGEADESSGTASGSVGTGQEDAPADIGDGEMGSTVGGDQDGPKGNITIEVLADEVVLDPEIPLKVYPGQPVEMIFKIKSSQAELLEYSIQTSAVPSVPVRSPRIEGKEYEAKWLFVLSPETWRTGGITIAVRDVNMYMYMLTIPVEPLDLPGSSGYGR